MAEGLRADVLLAAAAIEGTGQRLRAMETEVVGAAADWLWLDRSWWHGRAQLGLGLHDGEPPLVMPADTLADGAGDAATEDQGQPPPALNKMNQSAHNIPAYDRRRPTSHRALRELPDQSAGTAGPISEMSALVRTVGLLVRVKAPSRLTARPGSHMLIGAL